MDEWWINGTIEKYDTICLTISQQVFLKYYHVEELTRKYEEYLKKVVLAQAVARKWIAMRRYDQLRWRREKSSVIVQKCESAVTSPC